MISDTLDSRVAAIADAVPGTVSVCAADLTTGRSIALHADMKCPTASVIKLPILVHTYLMARDGALSLDEKRAMRDTDKVPGSGVLSDLTDGVELSVRDLCKLMIVVSDNTATNLVIDCVGVDAVTERMRSLGLTRTTLYRRVFRLDENRSPACVRYGTGATAARDMVRLLTLIARGLIGDAATSEAIRAVLARQQHTEGIARLLPPTCRFAGKSGAIDHSRSDVGLVTVGENHSIAIAVFCKELPTLPYTVDHPALVAIGRTALEIVREFAPEGFA